MRTAVFALRQLLNNNFYSTTFSCDSLDILKEKNCDIKYFLVSALVVKLQRVAKRDFLIFGRELYP